MVLALLKSGSSCAVVKYACLGLKFVLIFWAVVILCTLYFLKNLFSAISSMIIFVIYRSAKKYVHGEVHEEENAEANVLCV